MKWLAWLLLIPVLALGQGKTITISSIQPEFITITLDSTDSEIIYYIFPPPAGINSGQRTDISTTTPTSASEQAKNLDFAANGAFTISIVADSVADTMSTYASSDSFYAYIQTLIYDKNKSKWYRAVNDTMFLDFDTPQTYVGTAIDYLDWGRDTCYVAEIGGNIMPAPGFALTIGQVTSGDSTTTSVSVGFWYQK